ncbi:MAG: ATP-binding cassette domain-containing protein, partial [Bdellovibrionales bacterium]|nr:ATP-binding cassette domain-containing protein [Bdellovibrionales bacterium]
MNNNPIIKAKNLELRFNKKVVFSKISFEIQRNSISCIVGPSGCGKSSLLSCLNRMNEFESNSALTGSILFNDININDIPLQALRQKIGIIYQKPLPLPFSIEKNFKIPLCEPGIKLNGTWQSVMEESLKLVGLWSEVKHRLTSNALTLSGGQQQRLCIARTLALQPEVLLFDEPTSALDPLSCKTIESLLIRLKAKYTIFLVTHNLAQAKRVSDYCFFMWWKDEYGHLLEKAATNEFFNSPKYSVTKEY